jgi:hypothetical protein
MATAASIVLFGCKSDSPVASTSQGTQSIKGTVYDSSGQITVPGAQITTVPPTQSVVSDSHGGFVVDNVTNGQYAVIANKPGVGSGSVSVTVSGHQVNATIFLNSLLANMPPLKPSKPTPEDLAINQSPNVQLSWTSSDPDNDPITYDVYIGTSNPPTTIAASGVAASSYGPTQLQKQMTYYWRVVAKDDHGNSTQGPVWRFATGSGPGKALLLDGQTGYGVVDDASDLRLSGSSFTIEAWVRPDAINGDWHWILSKSNSDDDTDYLLALDMSNKFRFQTRDVSNLLYGSTTPQSGTWYHLAAVQDVSAGRVTLYVNGAVERVASLAGGVVSNKANLWIGARDYLGTGNPFVFFGGVIDEIRIWNVVRTPDEIRNNMNRTVDASQAGLVAYWQFEEGTGTQVADLTGHGHTIKLQNSPQWITSTAPIQ